MSKAGSLPTKSTLRVLRPDCLKNLMNSFSNKRKMKMAVNSAARKMTMNLNMRTLPLPPRRRRQKNMMVIWTRHSLSTLRNTSSTCVLRRWMMVPMQKCAMTIATLAMMNVMRGSLLK